MRIMVGVRHRNDLGLRMTAADRYDRLDAFLLGYDDIGHNEIRRDLVERPFALAPVAGPHNLVSSILQS